MDDKIVSVQWHIQTRQILTAYERIDKSNIRSRAVARLNQLGVVACKTTACMLARFPRADMRERRVEVND